MLSSLILLVISLHCFHLKDRMQVWLVSLKNTGLQVGAGRKYTGFCCLQSFAIFRILFSASHFLAESFLLNASLASYFFVLTNTSRNLVAFGKQKMKNWDYCPASCL